MISRIILDKTRNKDLVRAIEDKGVYPYQVEDVKNLIRYHATKYYTGQAEITDYEFDSLVEELRRIAPSDSLLTTPGWGYVPTLEKATHRFGNVGSLSKYRDVTSLGLALNYEDTRIIMPKYDGISCVAYYKDDGKFFNAVTRGNGIEGTDITDKFIAIEGDHEVSIKSAMVGIRGELAISDANWEKLKEEFPGYKNSRNACAGIISSKEMSRALKYIDFIPYKVQGAINLGNNTNYHMNNILTFLKFDFKHATDFFVVPSKTILDFSALDNTYKYLSNGYPCDGVVACDNLVVAKEDGTFDYNQYAFKFEDEKIESRVDHIEWNLTRTGKLAPVACIDPVELDGATIKRVTCFNAKYVKDNRIGKDAYIEIQRSGMVIPDIQKVTVECPEFSLPEVCPSCGEKLEWKGVDLVCSNKECASARYANLYRWVEKVSAVKGISRAGIDEFIDILGVESVIEIYSKLGENEARERLDKAAVGSATRKKYEEMISWLFGSMDPRYFLTGLNLEGIGWNVAESIAKSPAFEMLVAGYADEEETVPCFDTSEIEEELYKIPGIGWSTVNSLMSNIDRIDQLAKYIDFLKIGETVESDEGNKEVRYFCLTGSMEYGSRSQFCEYVKEYGWEMADIKKSEVLVTNNPDPTSSKGKKAKELGIPILTESEFIKMIKGD